MENILNKVSANVFKVQQNPAVQTAIRGAQSLQHAAEGGNPVSMVSDPRTGKFDKHRAAMTAARSVPTLPGAEKYMDKLLESRYGAFLPMLAQNPAIRQLVMRNPYASTVLDSALDRLDTKKFDYARVNALRDMGGQVAGLSAEHAENLAGLSGHNLVTGALHRRASINPYASFDRHSILREASRLKKYQTGEDLTPEEQRYMSDAFDKADERGFKKRGLHRVYSRRPGGLSAQRYRAAIDETSRRAQAYGHRVQAGGSALEEANRKIREVAEMEGPAKRVQGPKVDISKLISTYKDLGNKRACAGDLRAFSVRLDKKADNDTGALLDSLSSEEFKKRYSGKVKTRYSRDLDQEGGASSAATEILYSDGSKREPNPSLKQVLKKLKKELSFKENILYTMSGE